MSRIDRPCARCFRIVGSRKGPAGTGPSETDPPGRQEGAWGSAADRAGTPSMLAGPLSSLVRGGHIDRRCLTIGLSMREDLPGRAEIGRTICMRKRILVLAKDAALRAVVARILQPAGYAVELAGTAKRARELAVAGKIDAAIVAGRSIEESG